MITGLIAINTLFSQRMTNSRDISFDRITFFGYSGFAPSGIPINNVNSFYVGNTTGCLPYIIDAGAYLNIELPGRQKESLFNFFIKGTTGDFCYYIGY